MKGFIQGGFISFIAITYPSNLFGQCLGFAVTVQGVFSLLYIPLLDLALGPLDSYFLPLDIAFCASVLITMAHPVMNFLKISKSEVRKEMQAT